MVDTDDTRRTTDVGRRTTDDGRRTTPRVWHKLPTGELKIYLDKFKNNKNQVFIPFFYQSNILRRQSDYFYHNV